MRDNVIVLQDYTSGTPHHGGTPLENSGTPWGVRYTWLTNTGLYSLRVKIAYLDIKSKLANHHFVNILTFESAIQVLNGLAANMHNPAPAVKIILVRVSQETSFLNAINCD